MTDSTRTTAPASAAAAPPTSPVPIAPAPVSPHTHPAIPTGSTIGADRPCARCGFNLFGQAVVREPHYGLVAARCPECGQLAALQEYPALGRWAGRWAGLLAALWLLVLLGAMFVQFGPTYGLTFVVIDIATQEFSNPVLTEYLNMATVSGTVSLGSWSNLDPAWWAENRERVADAMGGPLSVVNTSTAAVWFPMAVISAGFGAFWSVALLGGRRRWAALIAAVPTASAVSMAFYLGAADAMSTGLTIRGAVSGLIRPSLLSVTMCVVMVSLLLGVWVGRPLSRLLVRLALPARMRTPLSVLWTRDGLEPPRAGVV